MNHQEPVSLELRERRGIVLLVLLALIHLIVFTSAFPFYNNVDEQEHLDLVMRYSHGDVPRTMAPPSQEALPYIALFDCPEYLWSPAKLPGGTVGVPPWRQPMADVRNVLVAREQLWKKVVKNHEASQPPLYYAVAGAWWRLCGLVQFSDGTRLYMLRFFNIIAILLLLLVTRKITRHLFPESYFMRMAVLAFIALMPQTAFYAINNDILAPLLGACLLLAMLKFQAAEAPSPRLAFCLGLAFAGTFLTKISNLPILAVAALFIGWKIIQIVRAGKLHEIGPSLAVLLTTAILPIAGWMYWCKTNFGDYTGSILKIQFLNWTNKPFDEWFNHPMFTPKGFWYFVSGNLSSLWQGEFLWHGHPLSYHDLNRFYVIFTLLMLLIAAIALFLRRPTLTTQQRTIVLYSFGCLLASFAFFALLSVKYDFHDCYYPSTAHPFFVSGRLMLGLLVPFLILIALGLDRLTGNARAGFKFAVLVLVLAFMVAGEVAVDWNIFPNPYNWYHM